MDWQAALDRKYANLENQTANDAVRSQAIADRVAAQNAADFASAGLGNARAAEQRSATKFMDSYNSGPSAASSVLSSSTSGGSDYRSALSSFNEQNGTSILGQPENTGGISYRYAMGGEVSAFNKASQMAGLPPADAGYIARLINGARQAAMQRAIAQQGATMGYAAGGAVDTAGTMLDGPGTGKSDSIPAVIDGQKPAALSKGEFHIPKHVVDYFGTKFFDTLVEKARMAGKKKSRKGAIANA